MRLESITLHGFKSFGDRIEVKMLPGITAVVGPNGCGKSNISDAVRWALGEQSAKALRGHRMEDLIFHGSASHKPVGLAEVELRFSNDGVLAVPWSEISVARRLYRTGESEYLLNKNVTRLRDILDLFAGTGANPRAYSVMDQDKLNHVLTAKPQERRVFIEEAAGIARYKQQRNETEGKLDAARQNLVRVKDVMDEVRRQLGSLERQAKKAQQYKALAAARRDIALGLLAADYAALVADEARLAGEIGSFRDREQGQRTRLSQLAGHEATERQALQDSDHRLSDLRQAVQKIQAEFERLIERREQMGVQLREAAEEVVRLGDEVRLGAERLLGLGAEREVARTQMVEAERLGAERSGAAQELEVEVGHHRGTLAEQRDRLEGLRLEQIRIAAERTDLIRSAGELRERESQLRRRAERLAAELAAAETEGAGLLAARTDIERRRDRALAQLGSLAEERTRLVGELEDAERRLDAAEAALAELRLTLAARRSGLEALRELERVREGYGSGVRALFVEGGGARVAGVIGTVADLIEVPPDLERAVEAVLGERLQWVVVERFEQARAAVAFLEAEAVGPATFVPLEQLSVNPNGGAGDPPPISPPDDAGSGLDWLVRRVAAYSPSLLHYLFGRVAIVDHLDRAEALWRKNGTVATYVTRAGEVLTPTGRLRGGLGREAALEGGSLLARKRQIRELEDEVQRLNSTVESAQDAAARLGAETVALRARLPVLEGEIHAGEAARLAGDKDLEQAIRERERVHRHCETIRLESGQVAAETDETVAMLGRLEQRIAAARDAEGAHEATIAGLRGLIESGQTREAELGAALTACRVDLASVTERVEALGRELIRFDQMEADLKERIGHAEARRTQLSERRGWLGEERERTDAAARDVAVERDRVEAAARQAAERHEALLDALRLLEQETRSLESEVGRLVNAIHDRELQATERRVRREELAQEAQRTFGLDESLLRERHDPARDLDDFKRRLLELDERLAAIGPVNLVADEEYRELDERLTFLRTQHDDLVGSIKDLEKALRGMTRTAQERFVQAFEEINREFGRIFERLFEGGRAELRLVEPEEGADDPLETGVELMAQPRGKRLQTVTLLSGGERALTGLALLFAIFYYRPSPFCVLDEVDAPLDDANIHRFLRVLRELTSQTQFLVITHNRSTMEAADVLYGVTMEEPGLSKLVSVNLNA
ncbi:MAG: chromosome segregation protein SMC [Candidatus Rokubacteria bacterium]|nr:chromosome segregation protein SMC [Candidatus Rokubacteria bacterium]